MSGCGSNVQQVVTIAQEPYEKLVYQTAEVQRGNLNASITLKLNPEGYERIQYYAAKEELKLEAVHVSVGDKVEKGDLLVSFQSERLKQRIEDYEDEKRQNELLVEHYENLGKIDASADYQADLKMLREDIQVAALYIEEAKSALAEYQIVAKENGIITDISEYLENGTIEPGVELLSQVCGTGNYQALEAETEVFAVGEVYPVTSGMMEYDMRLTDMTEGTLTFEPACDMSLVAGSEILTLTVEKPELKDVVYVNRHAVCTREGEEEDLYFVYVMQENGYQRAVPVTIGERVDENIVITGGLKGGEQVVIR